MENTTTTSAPRKTGKKVERLVLKTICSSLRIDPKAARRKLRKAGFSWHGSRERWTMTEAQATKVREILKESDIERAAKAAPKAKAAAKTTASRKPAASEAAQPSA
jgi:hypothetical protein